jgi:hypothetical protein
MYCTDIRRTNRTSGYTQQGENGIYCTEQEDKKYIPNPRTNKENICTGTDRTRTKQAKRGILVKATVLLDGLFVTMRWALVNCTVL